jgi:dTDP-4-dehydrorhamnose reductase
MTERPFVHKKAYANVKSNFIFHSDLVKIFLRVVNRFGIYNMGGKSKTIYNFAKKYNPDIKKTFSQGEFPLKQDMNLNKIYKALK